MNYIGTDPGVLKPLMGLQQIKEDWAGLNRTIELHKIGSEDFRPDNTIVLTCVSHPHRIMIGKNIQMRSTQSYIKYPTKV